MNIIINGKLLKAFSPKIRESDKNGPPLPLLIKHYLRGTTSWYNMERKENVRHKDWKRRNLSLIMDDIITYVENPRVSTNY